MRSVSGQLLSVVAIVLGLLGCAPTEAKRSPFETSGAVTTTGQHVAMTCDEIVECLIERMDPDTNLCMQDLTDEPEYERATEALDGCDYYIDNDPELYDDCLANGCDP